MMTKAKAAQNKQNRKGEAVFRPRARILRALGSDLIQNEPVALSELVKNAYDADAERATIAFHGPYEEGKGRIVVEDDGHGMSLEVIETAWMEPATVFKRERTHSPGKKRRYAGEKGIGRFAASILGQRLTIDSTIKGLRDRVHVEIDWGRFDNERLFLDEIKIAWELVDDQDPKSTGTTMTIDGLRENWDSDQLHNLIETARTQLARLVPPYDPINDFTISIECDAPSCADLTGEISSPDVLKHPHYKMKGRVSGTGVVSADIDARGHEYKVRSEDGGPKELTVVEEQTDARGKKQKIHREPTCGNFDFEFRVWDRDTDEIGALAARLGAGRLQIRRDLNAWTGISLYRDWIRVLTPSHDWLRLDARRVNEPVIRLSNNQISAVVYLTAEDNPGIVDQTNRMFLKDNVAFQDLQDILLDLIAILEAYRAKHRRPDPEPDDKIIDATHDAELEPLRQYIQKQVDDPKLQAVFHDYEEHSRKRLARYGEEISRYRRLSTIGQIVDRVIHDGKTPLGTIRTSIRKLRDGTPAWVEQGDPKPFLRHYDRADNAHGMLSHLFARLEPLGGKGSRKAVQTGLLENLNTALMLVEDDARDAGITLTLPEESEDITIHAVPADLQQIFLNLFSNAIYWLTEKVRDPTERRIVVQFRRHQNVAQIVFSDSGVGVHEDFADEIWKPYHTTKPDGHGIGLTIVAEAVRDHDGNTRLLKEGPEKGATFSIELPIAGRRTA